MRKTNEEFAAEVFRRSAAYRQERARKMRAAGSIMSVLCLALLGGTLYSRQFLRDGLNKPETSGVDEASVCEGISEAGSDAGPQPDRDAVAGFPVQTPGITGQTGGALQSLPEIETDGESLLTSGTETPGLLITEFCAGSRQLTLTLQNTADTDMQFQPADLIIICSQAQQVTEYPYTGSAAVRMLGPQETVTVTLQCSDFDGLGETFRAGVPYRIELGNSVQKFQIHIQQSQGG